MSSPSVTPLALALAAALPVPAPIEPAAPTELASGTSASAVPLPDPAGAAVVAKLTWPGGQPAGQLVVVVAGDLADALRDSPIGALEVAAAVQPALDAGAAAAGLAAERGVELPLDVALDGILAQPGVHAVPLLDAADAVVATLVVALTGAALTDAGRPAAGVTAPMSRARGLELLRSVEMEVTVELGRTRMTVRELLSLSPGAVVELDRAAGSPADLLVNGTLIAHGEIVVVDEDFGIRITDIVTPSNATADGSADSAA